MIDNRATTDAKDDIGGLTLNKLTITRDANSKIDLGADLTVNGGSLDADGQNYSIGTAGRMFTVGSGGTFTWKSGTIENRGGGVTVAGRLLVDSSDVVGQNARLVCGTMLVKKAAGAAPAGVLELAGGDLWLADLPGATAGSAYADIQNDGLIKFTGKPSRIISENTSTSFVQGRSGSKITVDLAATDKTVTIATPFKAGSSTFTVAKGNVKFTAGGTTTDTVWSVAAGQNIVFDLSTTVDSERYTWARETFQGDGDILLTNPKITVQGTTTFNANLYSLAGTVTVDPGGVFLVNKRMYWSGGTYEAYNMGDGRLEVGKDATVHIYKSSGNVFDGSDSLGSGNTPYLKTNATVKGKIEFGKFNDNSPPAAASNRVNFAFGSAAWVSLEKGSSLTFLDDSEVLGRQQEFATDQTDRGTFLIKKGGLFTTSAGIGEVRVQANVIGVGVNNPPTYDDGLIINAGSSLVPMSKAGTRMKGIDANDPAGKRVGMLAPFNLDDAFAGNLDGITFGVSGGTLYGSGTLTDYTPVYTFKNSGLVNPGELAEAGASVAAQIGLFTFDAKYTQTGALAIDLGGAGDAKPLPAGSTGPVAPSNGGITYDQIAVDGTIRLSDSGGIPFVGSLLLAKLPTFSAVRDRVFTVVRNLGTGKVFGEFAGLPDDFDQIWVGGTRFQISYRGNGTGGPHTGKDVTLTVVNNTPVAGNDVFRLRYGQPTTLPVAQNDFDRDGDPTLRKVSTPPAHGTLTPTAGGYVYTPDAGYTGDDSFVYSLEDDQGAFSFATVLLQADHPPTAKYDPFLYLPDGTLYGDLAPGAHDADGDPLTFAVETGPAHGTLSVEPGGALRYLPDRGYDGLDTAQVTVADGYGGTVTATLTFATVPLAAATDFGYTIAAGSLLEGNVLDHDAAANQGVQIADVSLLAGPAHGTLSLDSHGNFLYVPDGHFTGTDTFAYAVTDANGYTATATITITVLDGYVQP